MAEMIFIIGFIIGAILGIAFMCWAVVNKAKTHDYVGDKNGAMTWKERQIKTHLAVATLQDDGTWTTKILS